MYYLYTSLFSVTTWYWIAALVNRFFDLALLYVAACAFFRIRTLDRRKRAQRNNA
jgi:hypothetical protein